MPLSPLLYHLHHSRHPEDLPFWLDLVARQAGPVLELGCGTGRILIPILNSGYMGFGLDRDAQMLAFLRETWRNQSCDDAPVFIADMAAFSLKWSFDLIILPCNTFSILRETQRRDTLVCVRRCLSAEGVFAASLPNPAFLSRLTEQADSELEEVFLHPDTGDPVQVSSAWRRSEGQFVLTWHYDVLASNGQVERFSVEVRHSLDPVSVYQETFEAAGLRILDLFGDFDHSPFTDDSPNLIILAGLS
jgi:SAM-dependent methyltransferase